MDKKIAIVLVVVVVAIVAVAAAVLLMNNNNNNTIPNENIRRADDVEVGQQQEVEVGPRPLWITCARVWQGQSDWVEFGKKCLEIGVDRQKS